jgi:hypothetical protein
VDMSRISAHVMSHRWAAGAVSAFPRPEQAKPAAMPRDDCLRFDDMNSRPPVAPGVREPRPEETVLGKRTFSRRMGKAIVELSTWGAVY